MRYAIKPIPFKPPRLSGLSETLLASHYVNDYGGAVRRLNAIAGRIAGLDWTDEHSVRINGLKREELIAANAMILHEVYFDGLGGEDGIGGPAAPASGPLAEAIAADFGGVEAWQTQFAAMGRALAGGGGWVVLAWCRRDGRLTNHWATDHAHIAADSVPLMALDMYEHAYRMDFGTDAAAYIDAFFDNIHWGRPTVRFLTATGSPDMPPARPANDFSITPEDYRDMAAGGADHVLLDICLAEDMANRSDKLPAAVIRPPEAIHDWIGDLPADVPIVAYCVYGYQVSGDAVAAMRERGLNARRLAGGIAAWHAIGGPTAPLGQ